MLNYIDFNNCYIVKLENEIKAMTLYTSGKDKKTNIKYYIFKDLFTDNYRFVYNDNSFHHITKYMTDEELDKYYASLLESSNHLSIIARGIYLEQDELIKEKEKEIKKTLRL